MFLDFDTCSISFCGMDGREIYHFWYYEDRYYFNCQTKSGWIIKSIVFNQLEKEEFFNLALFDYLEVEKEWSDTNRSHPIKLSMLFFTVCAIVLDFLKKNPDAIVSFEGNTQSRSRLYNIFISQHLNFFNNQFQVLGDTEFEIEKFQTNKKYSTIYIIRK